MSTIVAEFLFLSEPRLLVAKLGLLDDGPPALLLVLPLVSDLCRETWNMFRKSSIIISKNSIPTIS